ncbi:MAG: DNA-binding response regulator [Desulfosporosinus sp.]|nr:DNA-binding response regulator [Desulfosporosinus sp.]
MGILPIILFLLGIIFLLLGLLWQSSPSKESRTAIKGLAYLKREITRIQDQLYVLEDKVQRTQQSQFRGFEFGETDDKEKSKSYVLNAEEFREGNAEVELQPNISAKYQEVLELAAHGQRIPEISQRLLLSQDAVRMVLRTQSKGETQ